MARRDVRSTVVTVVTRPLDWLGHAASLLWRSVFITAAALAGLAGLLHALGRVADAYSAMLVAGALGAVGTALGVVALRVEPDAAPTDAEVPR